MTSERTIILTILGLITIGTIASVCGTILLWNGRTAEGVFYLAATAVGSLASILAQTSTHHGDGGSTIISTVDIPAKPPQEEEKKK